MSKVRLTFVLDEDEYWRIVGYGSKIVGSDKRGVIRMVADKLAEGTEEPFKEIDPSCGRNPNVPDSASFIVSCATYHKVAELMRREGLSEGEAHKLMDIYGKKEEPDGEDR